jgi:hypothetical protein
VFAVFAHVTGEHLVPVGTTADIANCGCGSSLSTLTVTAITEAPASSGGAAPPADRVWLAEVDACEAADAGEDGYDGPELYDLAAVTSNGNVYTTTGDAPPRKANILDAPLRPGQCAQGYASFWVPSDESVSGIEYNPDGPFSRYEWTRG